MFVMYTQPHLIWESKAKWNTDKTPTHLDQLPSVLAIGADAVDDFGQVDSSSQVVVGHKGSDSHQVFITARWIHLFRK